MFKYNTMALLAAALAFLGLDLLRIAAEHQSPLVVLFGAIAGCGAYYTIAFPVMGILNAQADEARKS